VISTLREEIVAAISRHVAVEPDKVQVKMDRGPVISTLESRAPMF
jgi:cell division topological specificity factor